MGNIYKSTREVVQKWLEHPLNVIIWEAQMTDSWLWNPTYIIILLKNYMQVGIGR